MASERHREAIQRQIHQDWANREYIEVITNSIKKITGFLNSFGKICLFDFVMFHYSSSMFLSILRYVLSVQIGSVK